MSQRTVVRILLVEDGHATCADMEEAAKHRDGIQLEYIKDWIPARQRMASGETWDLLLLDRTASGNYREMMEDIGGLTPEESPRPEFIVFIPGGSRIDDDTSKTAKAHDIPIVSKSSFAPGRKLLAEVLRVYQENNS